MPLKRIRITRGKYFASGKAFKIIDDWTTRANAHRLIEGSWIGTTDFQEVATYIDDNSDEDEEEEVAQPLTEVPCMGPGELKVAPKLKEETAEESMKASRLTDQPFEPHKTECFEMSTQKKDNTAQPFEALARKFQRVPPAAHVSQRGRSGAIGSLSEALPSVTSRWRVSEGEYKRKSLVFWTSSLPAA